MSENKYRIHEVNQAGELYDISKDGSEVYRIDIVSSRNSQRLDDQCPDQMSGQYNLQKWG